MSRLTSVEEERRLSLYREGLSDREIARRLGLTHSAIRYWRLSRGLPTNPRLALEEERLRLYQEGLSDGEIAKRLGCPRSTIQGWRQRRGLPPNYPPHYGKYLSDEEEEQRMRLYRQGLNDREIAERLGLTTRAIHLWRRRRGLPANRSTRAINLYHQHRDWTWERLTYEAFKPQSRMLRRYIKEDSYGGLLIETYTYKGKTFKAYKKLDKGIDTWKLEEQYEVPKFYLSKVKEVIGLHLMEACRADPSCSLKPLLPEWEEE